MLNGIGATVPFAHDIVPDGEPWEEAASSDRDNAALRSGRPNAIASQEPVDLQFTCVRSTRYERVYPLAVGHTGVYIYVPLGVFCINK